jgi:hypothetical protein
MSLGDDSSAADDLSAAESIADAAWEVGGTCAYNAASLLEIFGVDEADFSADTRRRVELALISEGVSLKPRLSGRLMKPDRIITVRLDDEAMRQRKSSTRGRQTKTRSQRGRTGQTDHDRTPRTLGDALSNATLPSLAVFIGLLIAAVGSVAPWVTTPLSSASGINGDGKITIGLAAIAGLVLFGRGRSRQAVLALLSLGVAGVGIYDAIHIHRAAAHVTLFGQQLAHVGWGVYAVIAGGVLAFFASIRRLALL